MKNSDLFELSRQLDIVKDLKGVKFSFACARNRNVITPIIEALEEAAKPKEAFMIYETERGKLLEKFAKKDENDNPIKVQVSETAVQYDIEDTEGLEKAVEELKAEHADAVAEREAQIEEYNSLLGEEFDINQLTMIDVELIPEEITLEQLLNINRLVDFDDMKTEEIEITRQDVLDFDNNIMMFVSNVGVDFNSKMAFNYSQLRPLIVEIRSSIAPSERYNDFKNKTERVAVKYALRDEKNNILIDENSRGIKLDASKIGDMNAELTQLSEEYKEEIEAFNAKAKENEKYLKETIKVDLTKIDIDSIPEDVTPAKMNSIHYLIEM